MPSSGGQVLMKLAAQYMARQLPSTWLLPLALSSSCSTMSTLVQEGTRDLSRTPPSHQSPAGTPSGLPGLSNSCAQVHTAAVQPVDTAESDAWRLSDWHFSHDLSQGPDSFSSMMVAPLGFHESDELVEEAVVPADDMSTRDRYQQWRQAVLGTASPHSQLDPQHLTFSSYQSQILSEMRAGKKAQERSTQEAITASQHGRGGNLRKSKQLHQQWSANLTDLLEAQLKQARNVGSHSKPDGVGESSHPELWPLLARLGTRKVAEVAVKVFLQQVLTSARLQHDAKPGVGAVMVARAIGDALTDAVRWGELQDSLTNKTTDKAGKARLRKMLHVLDVAQQGMPGTKQSVLTLKKARQTVDALAAAQGEPEPSASITKQQAWWAHIGMNLISQIMSVARLPDGKAAISEETIKLGKSKGHRPVRLLKPTNEMTVFVLESNILSGRHMIDSRQMPMLVPPLPWQAMQRGGLLLPLHTAVRGYSFNDYRTWLKEADQQGQFRQLYDAMTALGNTRWRINRRVLQILEQAASQPEHIKTKLSIPSSSTVSLPEAPTAWGQRMLQAAQQAAQAPSPGAAPTAGSVGDANSWADQKRSLHFGFTPYLRFCREGRTGGQLYLTSGPLLDSEREAFQKQLRKARMHNTNLTSLAAEFDLCLSAAQQLADHPCFWQPHFVDFRGRAYPMSGYINHQRDDIARGLLEFADGKPLGKDGLDWLYIQIANCYGQGKDKLSLEGRRKFGLSCLPKCQATAADPWSDAGRWWQEGEDAWQLLATALDVAAAVASGSPAAYISHVPVHQDGSCNGLQHYAALGRDRGGAKAVNMLPVSAPEDVYTAVARRVDEQVRKDAEDQVSEAMKLIKVNDGVDRKLVKQTVMTTVYGVTFIGARDQIMARLVERGWSNESEVFQVACYLAKKTLASVADVFSSARFKTWLADSASCVAKTGQAVRWTSAVGFPIQQPYTRLSQNQREWVVDTRAQRTAFPPNFIHSLDASHMMMTALACQEAQVTFAGVHDSFFTHAGTVNQMSTILRRQFVDLHTRPLLQELAAEMQRMGVTNLPPIPSVGDLDISCVLDAPYFFS